MEKSLFCIEYEKQFLSSLVLNPHEIWAETHSYISDRDLTAGHRPIFQVIENLVSKGQEINKIIIIQSLINLNIRIFDTLSPDKYIDALSVLNVNVKDGIKCAKEIKHYSVRRKLRETGKQIQQIAEREDNRKVTEIVAECNQIYSKEINILNSGNGMEPQDLFGTAEMNIEHENGIGGRNDVLPPFERYHDMYGDFDAGGLHVFCSRMGVGKSTWLMNILEQCIIRDDDIVTLLLDTELEPERVQRRIVSSLSGVNEYFIKNKSYKRNKEMYDKVIAAFKRMGKLKGKLDHAYVGGMDLETQLALCRSWYRKNITGSGRRAMIALDYFKLGSVDNYSQNLKDYQLLGLKADSYKQLGTELECPILAAAQTNRSNANKNNYNGGSRVEDNSVVAGSDEIARFCSNLYLIQELTVEEQVWFDINAKLSLKDLKTRQLGPNLKNLKKLVKYQDQHGKIKYCDNYLLFSSENFKIEEVSSFQEIMNKKDFKNIDISNPKIDSHGIF